jgi:predicted TIM-barrel enzyme
VYGRADGLILTGHNFVASLEMLSEVREAKLGVPLLLGGSCNAENVAQALEVADGAIVSTGFKIGGGWTHAGIAADWDYETMVTFMEAARGTQRARNRAV